MKTLAAAKVRIALEEANYGVSRYRRSDGSEVRGIPVSRMGVFDQFDLRDLGFTIAQGQTVKGSGKLGRSCVVVVL